jgi:hypothetical protein
MYHSATFKLKPQFWVLRILKKRQTNKKWRECWWTVNCCPVASKTILWTNSARRSETKSRRCWWSVETTNLMSWSKFKAQPTLMTSCSKTLFTKIKTPTSTYYYSYSSTKSFDSSRRSSTRPFKVQMVWSASWRHLQCWSSIIICRRSL